MKRANDWLSNEPGARDFGALYLENLDAMNAAVEAQLVAHTVFGPLLARTSPEQRARRSDTRTRVQKALDGDWSLYAARLAEDGAVFSSIGLELADWFEVGTYWTRWFVPRLVEAFHREPARLAAAIMAMDSFLHAGLEIIGEAYLKTSSAREAERRSDRERWAALFEKSAWGVALVAEGEIIEEVNDAFVAMYGVAREALVGRSVSSLYAPGELERIRSERKKSRTISSDVMHVRGNGTMFPVHIEVSYIPGFDGKPSWVMTVHDLGDRRQVELLRRRESELEVENRRALEASRLKSEFLANMSHELRTPLNSIIGFSELLERGEVGPLEPEQREFVSDIHASGQHLLRLINDVLDLSKVEAGKLEFHPEPTRLSRELDEVNGVLRGISMAKNISIVEKIDADTDEVILDPSRLKQVLYNYLSNAIKFARAGTTIEVVARREGASAFRLEVRDRGPGIASDDLSRLFVEFEQLESGRRKRLGGTGLGLALTKRLVEAQGGSVGATSVLDEGSIFHAVLPLRAIAHRPMPVPVPRRIAGSSPNAPRILVVEDDALDQEKLLRILLGAGFAVDTAITGTQAIEAIERTSYAAITLDLLLPDASGLAVLAAMRRQTTAHATPVIVVSVVTANATGGFVVHDVIEKPLDGPTLVSSLARANVTAPAIGPILIVDDDERSAKLAVTTLANVGLRAVVASDGLAALARAREESPAAVVLDLVMPHLDGFGFLERFRAEPRWSAIPVVVWTVKDPSAAEMRELAHRAEAVLPKNGGGARLLLERLQEQLGRSRPVAGVTS